jgi:hypothetical protein
MMGFNYKRMTYAGILALNTKVAVCPSGIRQLVLFISFIFFKQNARIALRVVIIIITAETTTTTTRMRSTLSISI